MTHKAYNKHKEVMDWFYTEEGRELLAYHPIDGYQDVEIPNWNEEFTYIPNDKYVEFRKALVEGKEVIYKFGSWLKSKNKVWLNYDRWVDLKINPTTQPNGNDLWDFEWKCKDDIEGTLIEVHEGKYRIEPNKPKFKIGDYVRELSSGNTDKITELGCVGDDTGRLLYNQHNGQGYLVENLSKKYELWEPQEGDVVVCWDNQSFHQLMRIECQEDIHKCEGFINCIPYIGQSFEDMV